MANFDYHINPVVGTLSINESSGHGYIKVCGYMDGIHFRRLTDAEAQNIFTPNGEVFAANIQRNYYGMNNSLISLFVMENTREGGKNAFVWDWNGEVELVGTKIIQLDKEFGDNGQENYDVLQDNELLGKDDDLYVLSGDRLYYIKGGSDSRLIPFCKFSEFLPIIARRNSYYYIGAGLQVAESSIDTTTDEQLVDWFLRTIKTNWEDIQKGSGKVSLRAAKEALVSMKALPVNVVESRLHRLATMTDSYAFTRDNLKQLASAPWLQPSIEAGLARFKEDYIDTVLGDNKAELERIQSEHQAQLNEEIVKHNRQVVELHETRDKVEAKTKQQIEAAKQELKDAQDELEKANAEVSQAKEVLSELESSVSRIETRKSQIIEDFQIVREVLNIPGGSNNTAPVDSRKFILQYNNLSDKKLPFYKGFEKNLENCLKSYHVKGISVAELSSIHACYKVILLPNIQVATSIVMSAGQSWSYTTFVSVAWKSFEDLWNAGLGSVVEHCDVEPETIHYLVLRNINLSCLSNYLQPLADLQGSFIPTFPGTDKTFPANLRVLLTVSDEELLPMPESILRFFGCVTREVEIMSYAPTMITRDAIVGYLNAKLLSNAAEEINDAPNCFQDYLDE